MKTPTKVGIGILSLILICGGTPLYFYTKSDVPEAAGKLNENLAKAKQVGLWTTKKDFLDHYNVPGDQNSAEAVNRFIKATNPVLKDAKLTKPSGEIDGLVVKQLYLKLAPDITKLDEISKIKFCRFQRDYSRLPFTLLPEYAQMKAIGKFLSLRASLAVDDNDVVTAAACWRRIATIRNCIRQEAILIADLINTSLSAMTTRSMQHALNIHGSKGAWQQAVSNAIVQHDQPHNLLLVLKGEMIYSFESTDLFMKNPSLSVQLVSGDVEQAPTNYTNLLWVPKIREASISRYVEVFTTAAEKISPDYRNQVAIRGAMNEIDTSFLKPGLSRKIPSMLAPICAQWGEAVAKDYACYGVLKRALAMLRKQTTNDKTLDFDLKALRTKETGKGLVIYSIGQDRKDDDGDLTPTKPGSQTTKDFGVLIPR